LRAIAPPFPDTTLSRSQRVTSTSVDVVLVRYSHTWQPDGDTADNDTSTTRLPGTEVCAVAWPRTGPVPRRASPVISTIVGVLGSGVISIVPVQMFPALSAPITIRSSGPGVATSRTAIQSTLVFVELVR